MIPLPPDDVPIWDALLLELGDPRPYDSADLGPAPVVVVTDEPCVDDAGFDDAYSDLDDAVVATDRVLEALEVEGRDELNVVVTAFRDHHGIPVPPEPSTEVPLVPVGELTVIGPAIGVLDQLRHPPYEA